MKAVRNFLATFRSEHCINVQKADRWYKARDAVLSSHKRIYVCHLRKRGTSTAEDSDPRHKKVLVKAGKGRGRKQAEWVLQVQSGLLLEFERL